ncbi:MAG: hypothetical protein ABIC82_01525 [bacterium]
MGVLNATLVGKNTYKKITKIKSPLRNGGNVKPSPNPSAGGGDVILTFSLILPLIFLFSCYDKNADNGCHSERLLPRT